VKACCDMYVGQLLRRHNKCALTMQALWKKLTFLLKVKNKPLTPRDQAKRLIKAIDAGGLPLNAARVNDIARQIGLDVATTAPVEVTIARIRKVLKL
jgi:hypothetical protein